MYTVVPINVFNYLIDILTDLMIRYSPDPGDHWRRRSCCWRTACRTAWSRSRLGWISWFSSWTSSTPPGSHGFSCWGPRWCECWCSYWVFLSSAPPHDLWSFQTSPRLVWSQISQDLQISDFMKESLKFEHLIHNTWESLDKRHAIRDAMGMIPLYAITKTGVVDRDRY